MLDRVASSPREMMSSSSRGHQPHTHTGMSLPMSQMPKTSNMPLDMNIYATRKTVAQGMMDIALMTANASQLKYILLNAQKHKYLEATISLMTLSILLQVIIGIILIFLGRWNINYRGDQRRADIANNAVVILIFLVTVVNVMVSAFGPMDSSPARTGLSPDNWQVYPPTFKLAGDQSS